MNHHIPTGYAAALRGDLEDAREAEDEETRRAAMTVSKRLLVAAHAAETPDEMFMALYAASAPVGYVAVQDLLRSPATFQALGGAILFACEKTGLSGPMIDKLHAAVTARETPPDGILGQDTPHRDENGLLLRRVYGQLRDYGTRVEFRLQMAGADATTLAVGFAQGQHYVKCRSRTEPGVCLVWSGGISEHGQVCGNHLNPSEVAPMIKWEAATEELVFTIERPGFAAVVVEGIPAAPSAPIPIRPVDPPAA